MPRITQIGGEKTILYTQQEAADFLGIGVRTIRKYIRRGLIPAVTVRRRVYIWDKNLQQFLRGAKNTHNVTAVNPPQYEALDFDAPPDEWVE